MAAWPRDDFADSEARRVYYEGLRRMTGPQKFRMVAGMYETARALVIAKAREEHPDWSPEQLDREARTRLSRCSN